MGFKKRAREIKKIKATKGLKGLLSMLMSCLFGKRENKTILYRQHHHLEKRKIDIEQNYRGSRQNRLSKSGEVLWEEHKYLQAREVSRS